MKESTRLTREELYELVWSESMVQLSKQLGISDVGLSKVCDRMKIPAPFRGYWARVQAGQKVNKERLPKLPPNAPESIKEWTFYARNELGGAEVGTVRTAKQAAVESKPEKCIVVAEELIDPHPLVSESVKTFRGGKIDKDTGLISPRTPSKALAIRATMGSIDRALRIMDALIKALEARSYVVSIRETKLNGYFEPQSRYHTIAEIDSQQVEFSISEKVRRTEKKATDFGYRQYEYHPTGALTFQSEHSWTGVRQSWSDGARQRVEECLNQVVVGAVAVADALNENHRRRAAEEAERERRRAEEEQKAALKRIEKEKRKALDELLSDWRQAHQIREYVSAIRADLDRLADPAHGEKLEQWLTWAEAYGESIDPVRHFSIPIIQDPGEIPHWQR
jgi:hypothetical protein